MKIQRINFPIINNKVFNSREHSALVSQNYNNNSDSYKQISNCYYMPVNFTSKRQYSSNIPKLKERPSKFLPCRFNDLTCPSCGKMMLTKNKFRQIADEMAELPPDEYLDYLGQYKKYMRPVEESVYDELTAISKENSEKDIRTLLIDLRDEKLPILQKTQKYQLDRMFEIAGSLPADEKELLEEKLHKLNNYIYRTNIMAPFSRKLMIDKISKINISDPVKYKKLQQAAKAFPTSSDMNSAWIVKYSGNNKYGEPWDSYTIGLRLLTSSIPNTDHILAYSIENNHDDITNYIAMHSGCNTQKEDKEFSKWLNEDKENRIKYLKDYFLGVQSLIDDRRLGKKKYRHYVAFATERIKMLTDGNVQIFPEGVFTLTEKEKKMLNTPADIEQDSQLKND